MAGRRNHYEPSSVALVTTPAATDGHTHVATFDDDGNGITSSAPDGHWHIVHFCDVLAEGEPPHSHELTAERRSEDDDAPSVRPVVGHRGAPRRAEGRAA